MNPKPVKIGDPLRTFPGESFNALVYSELARRAAPEASKGAGRGTSGRVVVNVHNSESTTIEPGEILGFDEPIFTVADDANLPFQAPSLKGVTPTSSHTDRFVVATDFIRGSSDSSGGAIGPAVLMGLAWVKVNWTDDAHDHVKVVEGETQLQSSASGIEPIWIAEIPEPEELPADVWALIQMGGGGGKHFQVIRGLTLTPVTPLDSYFQIGSITEFEELAKLPDSPVWVASNGVSLGLGDVAWAVYHKDYATFEIENPDYDPEVEGSEENIAITVDWVYLPTSAGSSTPPLRRFELTVAKIRSDSTATVRWLDDAGAMTGPPLTIWDPSNQFSGMAADYVGTIQGFRGVALLRTDLGGIAPDRWEMIAMEGFAETILVTWDSEGSGEPAWKLTAFYGDQWEWKRPAADGDAITVADPLGITSDKVHGSQAVCHLMNPDTTPPEYEVRTYKQTGTSEQKRLISGTVKALTFIPEGSATFDIDNIKVLGRGLDPRIVPGDADEVVEIHKTKNEILLNDEEIIAAWNDAGSVWEMVPVERYRMIRGRVTSTASGDDPTFTIDNIKVVASGVDPRTDTTNSAETVEITNIDEAGFLADRFIYAVFVAKHNQWWPFGAKNGKDGSSGIFVAVLDADIDGSSSPSAMNSGTGHVWQIGMGGVGTDLGVCTIYNSKTYTIPAHSSARYSVTRSYLEIDPETGDPITQEFTIVDVDPVYFLLTRSGHAAEKVLFLETDDVDGIKWDGEECEDES